MTAYEAMRRAALAEFDRLVADQERVIRATMAAEGCRRAEIDTHIANCQPNLEAQRREIGRMVAAAFTKSGVPLETTADVWK